jgi:hypothetical protein
MRGPLSKNGLSVIQTTAQAETGVLVETTLAHSSGEWVAGVLHVKPVKDDPQGLGSAITYARRYALSAMVGVAPEDDDGNAASGKHSDPAVRKAVDTVESMLGPVDPAHAKDKELYDKITKAIRAANGDRAIFATIQGKMKKNLEAGELLQESHTKLMELMK